MAAVAMSTLAKVSRNPYGSIDLHDRSRIWCQHDCSMLWSFSQLTKRPTNSAVECWLSDTEPPLPQKISLFPEERDLAIRTSTLST